MTAHFRRAGDWRGDTWGATSAVATPRATEPADDSHHERIIRLRANLFVAPNDQGEPVIWEPGIVTTAPLPLQVRSDMCAELFDAIAACIDDHRDEPVRFAR